MRLWRLVLIGLTAFTIRSSFADEQTRVLATSGEWAAFAHAESQTAAPDVCMLANMRSKIAFRQDADHLELRVMNYDWSLPTGVSGNIGIVIGLHDKSYAIDANTATSVSAVLFDDEAQTLFAAMDKSTQMKINLGKDKPMNISLVGSAKASMAFKTCAGFKTGSAAPGGNPFQ